MRVGGKCESFPEETQRAEDLSWRRKQRERRGRKRRRMDRKDGEDQKLGGNFNSEIWRLERTVSCFKVTLRPQTPGPGDLGRERRPRLAFAHRWGLGRGTYPEGWKMGCGQAESREGCFMGRTLRKARPLMPALRLISDHKAVRYTQSLAFPLMEKLRFPELWLLSGCEDTTK